MPRLFGKKFSLPNIFQKSQTRGPTLKGVDGFTDPMLDAQWIVRTFNIDSVLEATRYQACYFAAWMHVDTPELLSSQERNSFSSASNQLDPSSSQAASVLQMADMTMSVSVDGDAATQLRKYYQLLSVVRSASFKQTRSSVQSVWNAMLAGCGGDSGQAETIATKLNQTVVPVVMEEFIRYLQGVGGDRQPGGSILIPTGSGYELRTVMI